MGKLLMLSFILCITGSVFAQKGQNQLRFMGEGGFPLHREFRNGWGGYLKYLHGVGNRGQVTLTTGYSRFGATVMLIGYNGERTHLRTIPLLLGYKHNIKGFYVEPQAGFGELGGRDNIGGDWSRQSVGASYISLGVGYEYQRWDVGARYQVARGAEDIAAGDWYRNSFEFVGVHIGYTFWSNRPVHTPGP